jgi:hypothetical protein
VRAPAGNLCGTIGLSGSQQPTVGLDGSLIAISITGSSPPTPACSFGACCRAQWWTGLFR